MKLLSLLLTFVSVAQLSARAQGTFNASNNYTMPGASQKAFVLDCDFRPLAKALGRVQIINAADGSTLSPGGDRGVPLLADGLFFINWITVPGTPPGGTANIEVRVWDVSSGSTWESAQYRGRNGPFAVTKLGGGTTPAATFSENSSFGGVSLQCMPEPTTLALATLGIAGLFAVAFRGK